LFDIKIVFLYHGEHEKSAKGAFAISLRMKIQVHPVNVNAYFLDKERYGHDISSSGFQIQVAIFVIKLYY